MFKGTIAEGTTVTAKFSLDRSGSGTAALLIAYSAGNGGESDGAVVAPGATGSASVAPNTQSMLRVFVDVSSESDTGMLEVTPVTAEEAVTGDTTWTYAVG